jgi:hypothetical protein
MAKSKLRLRVLAADVYRLVNGSLSRNEQCGPITGYNFDCPSQAPTASDFNFQITSNPAGLTLDNYFTLDASTAQTPNQTEVLVSADWTALCNNYSLADNEMFCIEAMIVGSTILRNTSYGGNGTSEDDALCTDNSCVSWASTDEHGQGIVVYTLNGTDVATEEDPSAFRYNANVLFCAGDGQNIVRWDPTLTVNSGSAVPSAAAALPLLLLLLFF